MCSFSVGDIVGLGQDDAVVGEVYLTWSDVESENPCGDEKIYVHKSTPAHVLHTWRTHWRPCPGYVGIEFLLPQDGYCLIAERSLRLRDRSLVMGDIVKRKPSDAQSGRVLSLSTECTLLPAFSIEQYARIRSTVAHRPRSSPRQQASVSRTADLHGFPENSQAKQLTSPNESTLLKVPIAELSAIADYEEDDYVIYDDWIGRIDTVLDEVTVRLMNGSVVVVEDPDDLEVSYYVPGTSSYELVQRLDRAGYYRAFRKYDIWGRRKPCYPDYCYPGQHVRTQKGNLRRGRWVLGAYDPSVEPQGIVVAVRVVEIHVEWLVPNILNKDQVPGHAPPVSIGVDILHGSQIKTLGNGGNPSQPLAKTLATATYRDDMSFATQVRFKDPNSAAAKYGYKVIPRTETQGFDMNVLHIVSTCTKVLVQWQDGSTSIEPSISLISTQTIDAHEVWPGDKVSLKADETIVNKGTPVTPGSQHLESAQSSQSDLLAKTIGVVQTVNAIERLAKVRWFQNADFKLDFDKYSERYRASPSSTYGYISERTSEVSLYDISAYHAFSPRLAYLVVAESAILTPCPQLHDHFGRVSELCLDGEVIVRCFAASPPRDIKVPISNLTIVSRGYLDEYQDEDGSDDVAEEEPDGSLGSSVNGDDDWEPDNAPEPIDIQIEYEGGENMDVDEDEDAWSTDDGTPSPSDASVVSSPSTYEGSNTARLEAKIKTMSAAQVHNHVKSQSGERPGRQLAQVSIPAAFLVLEDDPPNDHHYIGQVEMAAANIGKKAIKEHKVMRSSLPSGVFVRTWESRLDLLRVLVVGPVGTPFEHAPYLFDLQLATSFPDIAPKVFFHSWTNNLGQINPNLYEDGKVCLSLLGTWPADQKHEGWSKQSTVLQILVSILGLVLVKEPYYNEPGLEIFEGSQESLVSSRLYNEKVFIMAKGFISTLLSNSPGAVTDVVHWLYYAHSGPQLLDRVICECQNILQPSLTASQSGHSEDMTGQNGNQAQATSDSWIVSMGKLSSGALVPLRRHIEFLVQYQKYSEPGNTAATLKANDEENKRNA